MIGLDEVSCRETTAWLCCLGESGEDWWVSGPDGETLKGWKCVSDMPEPSGCQSEAHDIDLRIVVASQKLATVITCHRLTGGRDWNAID